MSNSIYAPNYTGPKIHVTSELDYSQNETQYDNQTMQLPQQQGYYQGNGQALVIPQEQNQDGCNSKSIDILASLLEESNEKRNQQEIKINQLSYDLTKLTNQLQNQKRSTIYTIISQDGNLYFSNGYAVPDFLCPDFIKFIVWVTVEYINIERFLAIGLYEKYSEKVIFLTEKELTNESVLKKFRIITGERIEINGIADSKIIKALNHYLLQKTKENEEIIIPKTAGWNLEKKKFYYMQTGDIFESILKNKFSGHPIVKRELSQESYKEVDSCPFPRRFQNTLWEVTLFGSVIHSLLSSFGFKKFFGVWLYDDVRSQDFINGYLKIWHEYIPEGDAGSTRELKELFNESKDELVVIREHMPSATSKSNIERILHCLETGCEFSKGVSIDSTPIFITKSYEIFQKQDLTVFPFLFREDDTFDTMDISCHIISPYLKWFEERFSNGVLQRIQFMNDTYKISKEHADLPFIKLFLTIKVLIQDYHLYQKNPNANEMEIDIIESETQIVEFIQYVSNFNNLSAIETVQECLKDAYNNEKIVMKAIDDVNYDDLHCSLIYDRNFYTYISVTMLESLLNKRKGLYKSAVKNIVQRLVNDDMLETERNGEGRIRADIKVSIPRGCGRNQNRFYKFKPGVLLNESGYLIGTTPKINNSKSIVLGVDQYGYEIYYPYLDTSNMHITVTGVTGSGKTTLVHKIVYQICKLDVPCLLLDYSQSFNKSLSEPEWIEIIDIADFPINPLARRQFIDSLETVDDCALRSVDILEKVFQLKPKDVDYILDILYAILKENKIPNFDTIYRKIREKEVEDILRQKSEKPKTQNKSQFNEFKGLCNKEIFTKTSKTWDEFLSDKAKLKVVQMDKLGKDTAALLTDLLLLDLIDWKEKQTTETTKKMVLWLDEIQNLTPAEDMIGVLLREMRKFGIGVIAISQAFHDMTKKMQTSLQQAALKLYFRQDAKGARKFANNEAEALTELEMRRLAKEVRDLPNGDFYAVGQFLDVNGNICDKQCRKVYRKD